MIARRALAVCLATVLALALMVPVVLAAEETVEDSFATISYSGGSGWTSDWAEVNDDNKANTGIVRAVTGSDCVSTGCIRFNIGLLSLDEYAIWRRTDISGATGATLTFQYKRSGVGVMQVWTRSGPSDAWAKTTLTGGSGGYSTVPPINIAADASATTEIRFNISSLLLGASAHIDNVLINASYPTTTTSTTTTTTATTTTSPTTTTTTTEPTVTLPTVTVPPLLTTTTTASSSTTTTTASSSTTTTTGDTGTSTTTSTAPPVTGGGGSGSPPGGGSGDEGQATVNPPLTEDELDLAAESNIVVNLAGDGDFGGFEPGIGINPMTDLWVNLNTTVEAISTEILSALALGAMIAFFGVRRVTDDDAVPQT